MGILTDDDEASEVVIERSEFAANAVADYEPGGPIGHNIYVGRVGRFELKCSYVHGLNRDIGRGLSRAHNQSCLHVFSHLAVRRFGGALRQDVLHTENIPVLSLGQQGVHDGAMRPRRHDFVMVAEQISGKLDSFQLLAIIGNGCNVYNALGVPVAAGVLYPFFGLLLSPMIAAAAMSFSSVSVVGNALRLQRLRL
jgi:hypothetical protein